MANHFGSVLRSIRRERGLSQEELGKLLGTSKQVVSRYETGLRTPKITAAARYAEVLGVSLDALLGTEETQGAENGLPLLGRIACGPALLAVENREGTVPPPPGVQADFALTCSGWSMTGDRMHDGDIVYIRLQPAVENGEIAAVLIGDNATLKHVWYTPGKEIVLKASNPAVPDQIFSADELDSVRILGKAVGFFTPIQNNG